VRTVYGPCGIPEINMLELMVEDTSELATSERVADMDTRSAAGVNV
jgi:hypothetical protein